MNSLLRKVGTEDIQSRTYNISKENILYTANLNLFQINRETQDNIRIYFYKFNVLLLHNLTNSEQLLLMLFRISSVVVLFFP